MNNAKQFTYTQPAAFSKFDSGLPFVQISLIHDEQTILVPALVDSAASISVLPYNIGLQLGLVWENQNYPIDLTVLLQGASAYGVVLMGKIDPFPAVPLAFAWTQRNDLRLILGQLNFFKQFDVFFYGSKNMFEIVPKSGSEGTILS